MIIACPKCNTGFFVTPEQIGLSGRRVKCSKCSHIWHAKIYHKLIKKDIQPEEKQDKIDYKDYKFQFEKTKKSQADNFSKSDKGFDYGRYELSDKELEKRTEIKSKNNNENISNLNNTKISELEDSLNKNIQNNYLDKYSESTKEENLNSISKITKNIEEKIKSNIISNVKELETHNHIHNDNGNLFINSESKNEENKVIMERGSKPIINLPALVPIKIPFYLILLPLFFLVLIFYTIFAIYPSVRQHFGIYNIDHVSPDLTIKDVFFYNDEYQKKLFLNYSIENKSDNIIKTPYVEITLLDKDGFEISKIADKSDYDIIEPNQTLNFSHEFYPLSDLANKVKINLANNNK